MCFGPVQTEQEAKDAPVSHTVRHLVCPAQPEEDGEKSVNLDGCPILGLGQHLDVTKTVHASRAVSPACLNVAAAVGEPSRAHEEGRGTAAGKPNPDSDHAK